MQAFRFSQRDATAGRGDRSTLVAARGIKVVLDPCQAQRHVDLAISAHWQPLGHQLRDPAFGQTDACGERGLGFGGVEFSQIRPQTLEGSCAVLPRIQIGPKGTAAFPILPD